MKSVKIILLIALLGAALSKTCGEGAAVASFEAEITGKIPDLRNDLKTQWTAWKATSAVPIADGKAPKACEAAFAGKKTCCTADSLQTFRQIYGQYIKTYLDVGGSFMGMGAKKGFKGDQVNNKLFPILLKCSLEYLQKHPELNKTTSASGSVSGSITKTDSQKKVEKALEKTEQKSEQLLKKTLAQFGLWSLRLFRGTQCALCVDPDVPIDTIWKDGAAQVKDTDVTDIKNKVKQALNETTEAAQLSHLAVRASQEGVLKALECQAGLDLIASNKPEELYCKDAAACATVADSAVNSAWTLKNDALVADNPTGRVLAGASLSSNTNGLAGQTADTADEGDVTVSGQTVDQLDSDAKAADTELKADPVDLEAEIGKLPDGMAYSSIMMYSFSFFIIIAGLMF